MTSKNTERVDRFRQLRGNLNYKEKYDVLRKKYDIPSVEANKMKFWSTDRIIDYLYNNDIKPLKSFRPEKEAARL